MKLLFKCIFILMVQSVVSQNNSFKKNNFSLETGYRSRGTIGITYTRNFLKRESIFFSTDLSGGLGGYWKGQIYPGNSGLIYVPRFKPIKYLCVEPVVHVGKRKVFCMLGLSIKWLWITHIGSEPSNVLNEYHFVKQHFTVFPSLGIEYLADNGFSFKARTSLLMIPGFYYEHDNISFYQKSKTWASFGLAFGYSF